jgi:hypothetical protein
MSAFEQSFPGLSGWDGPNRAVGGRTLNGMEGWFPEVPPCAAERPGRAHHGHPAEPGERPKPDIQASAPGDGDGWKPDPRQPHVEGEVMPKSVVWRRPRETTGLPWT